jgi:putative peptidoglycan lipid II flippase
MQPASEPSTSTANRQIARAAATVMLAFVLSNLVGLARNMIVIRAFGASSDLDSFYAANRITELLFNLMAGGALGSAFIPTFAGILSHDDQPRAWRLASSVSNLLLLVLTLAALLAAFFAPQIVRYGLYALDPAQNPVQEAITVRLLRIMLPSVVIFGLSGLIMGILNAHQIFLIPAITPALYSLGWILGVVIFPVQWGIDRLAWGTLLGSLLHLAAQLPNLVRLRGRFIPALGLSNPDVRTVMRLMGPRLFGVAVVQLNFIVNTIIALDLPGGSVTSISQGFALMLMPQMAIAQSIAIAAMPTFSAQVARGRQDEMRASLTASLRGVLLLSIPAMVGLILLRRPLVNLLYLDGQCGATCTQMISWALLWYAAGLVGHSLVEILSRAFYALHDTRTPVLVGVAAMSLNVVFSLLFTGWFARLGWMPLGGLALSNSLATTLEMIALLVLMRRRLGGLQGQEILRAVGAASAGALVMGAVLWLGTRTGAGWADAVQLVLGMGLGGSVYAALLAAMRVKEIRLGWAWVARKIAQPSGG